MAIRGDVIAFGSFRLILSKRIFLSGDIEIALGDRAFDVLALLASRAGQVVSKREILEYAWPGLLVDEANLRAQIGHIRAALGDAPDNPTLVLNVRGRGYVFTADVDRSSSPDTGVGRRRRLPRRSLRLLGREHALEELLSLTPTRQLNTIVGPGGLGKTVLAIEVAHRLAASFGDDVCFVDLGSLEAPDLVLPTIASALGYSISSEDLLGGLVTAIADRNALVIFDCCEHVLDEVCKLTTALLHEGSRIRILATSRESLRAEGEHVYFLQPLDLPAVRVDLSVDEASAASSVQLFMERASARGYLGELHDDNAAPLAEICRQLDGNPLAIELVASRLETYGFSGLLEALSSHSVLRWPGRRDDVRHQSLQTTLDWSFHLLSPEEQRVLTRLSILSGSFSVTDAEAVACFDEDDVWGVVRAIEGLADKSLLAPSTTEGRRSFRMLDVTRLYARMKLVEGGESREVALRHADWCSTVLAVAYPLQHDEGNAKRSSAESTIGNIRSALEWCFSADGDIARGIALAAHASRMFLDLSMLGECVRWCRISLGLVNQHDPVTPTHLELQERLAVSLMYTGGNHEHIGEAIGRGLEMATALEARQSKLHLLAGYNLYHTRRGDYTSALDAACRFALIADGVHDPAEAVAANWMLGSTHHLLGDEVRGEDFLERGYSGAEAIGNRSIRYFGFDHQGRAAISRAWIAWLRGRPDRATFFVKQALAAARNHPVSMVIAYLYTGWTVLWLRDLDWAEELAEALSVLAGKHQMRPYLTGAIALKGELLLARGRADEAADLLGHVTGSLRQDRQYIILTPTLRAYAEALARVGQVALADEIITDLVDHTKRSAPSYMLPELIRTRGDICLARRPDGVHDAEAHYREAISQARVNGALGWELRAATALARLWIAMSRRQDAHDLLQRILSQFTEGQTTADYIEAQSLLH